MKKYQVVEQAFQKIKAATVLYFIMKFNNI